MTLRFLGIQSDAAGHRLERFGQAIDLPDEQAEELLYRSRVPVIPDADFQEFGFTPQELADYQFVGMHADAAPAFLDKKRSALLRLHEIREHGPQATAARVAFQED